MPCRNITYIIYALAACYVCCTSDVGENNRTEPDAQFVHLIAHAEKLDQEGKIDSGTHYLTRVYQLADSIGSEAQIARVAGLLGNHYLRKVADIRMAQEYLDLERDLLESQKQKDVNHLIGNYLNHSLLRVKKLDLPYAYSYVMKAFGLAESHEVSDPALLAEMYCARGLVYYNMLEYQKAIDDYSFALELIKEMEYTLLENRIALGHIYCYVNRRDENTSDADSALVWLERFRLMNPDDPAALVEYENLLGIHYYLDGTYARSIEHLSKSADYHTHYGVSNPYNRFDTYLVLSAALQFDGRYEDALRAVDSALVAAFGAGYAFDDLKSDIRSIVPYASRAEIVADIGMKDTSMTHIFSAISIYDSLDALIRHFVKHDSESYLHHQFYNNFYYFKRIQICAFTYGQTHDQKWLHSMHDLITQYKAQSFLRDRILNNLYHSEARKFKSFRNYVTNDLALEESLFRIQNTPDVNDYALFDKVNGLLREREQIISSMQQEAPQILESWTSAQNISADSLLAFTKARNSAVINYYIGNPFYNKDNIYVLSAVNGSFTFDIIDSSSQILMEVDSLYRIHAGVSARASPFDTALYFSSSYHLYQQLIEPIVKELKGAGETVIIPDHILHRLSFEALVMNKPQMSHDPVYEPRFLVEDINITYSFSPNSLFRQSEGKNISHTLDILAMGFSDEQTINTLHDDTIPELLGSIGELNIINQLKGDRKNRLFRGNDCTKQNFFRHAHRASIIHLSTHGTFDPENRHSSMLYMRNPRGGLDGLYQHELRYENISPNLLILSACDSGAGKLSNEEGMFSVGRAFQAAGTQNVVSALWPLSDRASRAVFERFYRHLFNGSTASVSLRFTKLEMLRSKNQYAFPAYWSALVCHM